MMTHESDDGLSIEALLDEGQVSELLKISRRALQAWRYRRVGPPYVKVSGRAIRYRKSDLLKWVEERVVTN